MVKIAVNTEAPQKVRKPRKTSSIRRARLAPQDMHLTTKKQDSPKNTWIFIKFIFWIVGVAAALFTLLNWGFVSARVSYFFLKPDPTTVLKPVSESSAEREGSWPKDTLAIPSLGVSVPVQYISEQNETAFQAALAKGVVHYPGSSMPGQVGNVYIFGHSSDYAWNKGNYKHVFALLPKIKTGAEIKLTDSKGFLYTYFVKRQTVVASNDVSVLSQETGGKKLLTLQTSYPVGTALKRYVVVAELRQSD